MACLPGSLADGVRLGLTDGKHQWDSGGSEAQTQVRVLLPAPPGSALCVWERLHSTPAPAVAPLGSPFSQAPEMLFSSYYASARGFLLSLVSGHLILS